MTPGGADGTGLWLDTTDVAAQIARFLDDRRAVADAAHLVNTGAVVLTGNGASYYAAHAAALVARKLGRYSWSAMPAGMLLDDPPTVAGTTVVVVSTSGELRDIVELLPLQRLVVVTAEPASSIGRSADHLIATPRATQRAIAHTGAYAIAYVALLSLLAASGSEILESSIATAPAAVDAAVDASAQWLRAPDVETSAQSAVCLGTGVGWGAALECALLLKEVAGLPAEGVETREAATSSMSSASAKSVFVAATADALSAEALSLAEAADAATTTLPGATGGVLAPLTALPGAVALALHFSEERGTDPDKPIWYSRYLATARVAGQDS